MATLNSFLIAACSERPDRFFKSLLFLKLTYLIHRSVMTSSTSHFAKFCNIAPATQDFLNYNEAIKKLNALQSNSCALKEAMNRLLPEHSQSNKVQSTLKYLKRVGVNVDELENKAIHISGTKGKGSTAMLTESILRQTSYKTGLFTSPHLISVRERISINGEPLSLSMFVDYFWQVYNPLYKLRDYELDMPSYFKFLTVMACKVFISENVDVAIMEVGIGGELDCTNFLRKTPIVGITSIGLDHTKVLGDSVEKIAWQKAGILKAGCKAFTIPTHKESVLDVLKDRAAEKQCQLVMAPSVTEYSWGPTELSSIQKLNVSLALQLAKAWDVWNNNRQHLDYDRLQLSQRELEAIKTCQISGRCQIIQWKGSNVTYFLDGGHTVESIQVARDWFQASSGIGSNKILIFNVTGGRSARSLLEVLMFCQFSKAIFCTNNVSDKTEELPSDLIKEDVSMDKALSIAKENLEVWLSLKNTSGVVVSSVSEAITLAQCCSDKATSVLITGSLHLVGSALFLLRPS